MATNDFLPFAGGAGANVIDQPTYAALTALLANGFSSGTAQSAQLNKVWRQSSIAAAILAQFIVDSTGQNATDDGTTATLLANLKAAVRAQSLGLVGSMRNGKASVTAASASLAFTADQVVVAASLSGLNYVIPSFNKTVNLATTGAGGMDTGTAPVSGYVALYAIYNPATGASALLATNATSAAAPTIYGGANMPAGYTASALVSVWPTNGSGQFAPAIQYDRVLNISYSSALSSSTTQASLTALSISSIVPANAKSIDGVMGFSSTATSVMNITLSSWSVPASTIGFKSFSLGGVTASGNQISYSNLLLMAPQTLYYSASSSGGTPTFTIYISGYTF